MRTNQLDASLRLRLAEAQNMGPVYVTLDARTLGPLDAIDPRGALGIVRVPVNPAEVELYRQLTARAGIPGRHTALAGSALAREIVATPLRPGGSGLPFYDAALERLSQQLLQSFLLQHGLEASYATQAAQYFQDSVTPQEFYQPLWSRYGQTGGVDLAELVMLTGGSTRMPNDVAERRQVENTRLRRPRQLPRAAAAPVTAPATPRFQVPPERQAAPRRSDANTALLQHRIQQNNEARTSPESTRRLVDELKGLLTSDWLALDFNVSHSNIHDVLDKLSKLDDASLAEVVEHVGPELLPRLEEWSSTPDRITYNDTLNRVREARNRPRATVESPTEAAEQISDQLSYSLTDWEISDTNARNVIDRMSRLPASEMLRVADKLEPHMLHRLIDNLDATDKATYAPTIARLEQVMNTPRGSLTSEAVAKDVEWYMAYGVTDYEITEDEARTCASKLATLSPAGLEDMVRRAHPDYLNRIEPELSADDRRLYAPALARLRDTRARLGL